MFVPRIPRLSPVLGVRRSAGTLLAASTAVLAVFSTTARPAAAGPQGHGEGGAAAVPASQAYPLDVDPITGESLGDPASQVVILHEGREIRFAGPASAARFREDPAAVLARLDARIIAEQLPLYPLDTCVVSGKAFSSSMGEPVSFVEGNRLVRFCCAMCEPKFREDPEGYLARLDEAVVREQESTYPLDTCVISGEKLGAGMGKPVDLVFANRLVRLCCAMCTADFAKDPVGSLAKIDRAAKDEAGSAKAGTGPGGAGHEGHEGPEDGYEHGEGASSSR